MAVAMISQTQNLFAREGEPLSGSSGNGHDTISPLRLISTAGSDGDRGLPGAASSAAPRLALNLMTDKAWAVAFTMNVAITALSATYFFPSALTVLGPILEPRGWDTSDSLPWALTTCLLVATSTFTVSLSLLLLSRHMTPLQVALGIYVLVLTLVMWILPYPVKEPVGAILPVVSAVISYCFLRLHGVHLAAATLKVASLAITSTPKIISWAFCATIVRYMWLAVGITAYVGSMVAFTTAPASPDSSATHEAVDCKGPWSITLLSCECRGNVVQGCKSSGDNSSNVLFMVFWAASISWSSDVGANVVAATVADSVASRWSSTDSVDTAWQSCRRVTHSSLGSLCKVAAIDCLSRPLQFVVFRQSNAFWVADALMLYVRFAVSYVLLQPLACVSINQTSFRAAVKRAWAIYCAHGATLLASDSSVIACLSFLCVVFSALPFIVTVYVAAGSIFSSPPSPRVTEIFFIFTMAAISATLEVLLYAFKAVFICLVQDPESLAENCDRPPHHDLYRAWRKVQSALPEELEAHGDSEL